MRPPPLLLNDPFLNIGFDFISDIDGPPRRLCPQILRCRNKTLLFLILSWGLGLRLEKIGVFLYQLDVKVALLCPSVVHNHEDVLRYNVLDELDETNLFIHGNDCMQKLVVDVTHVVLVADNRKLIFACYDDALFVEFDLPSKSVVAPLAEAHGANLMI